MKRIAIYSRKSKFTGKGDSIENQIEMCKEYIRTILVESEEYETFIYEDEGISGKTLDRPKFKEFMNDEKNNPFDYFLVYRLDRVSRNVGDFSKFIEELKSMGTEFVSIKEKFDTSSPMGRAMMHIAAVFAHLERETIAERIKDNMYMLAKTGRWLGGTAPLGYKSLEHTVTDGQNKKSYFTLETDEDNVELAKLIFRKYSELQSLNATEIYLNETCNYTRNGNEWDKANIKRILSNPTYCMADKDSLKYFTKLGCIVCFDENDCEKGYGIAVYNRHPGSSRQEIRPNEWIIAISTHKPLLTGKEWIRIQNIIEEHGKDAYGGRNNSKRSLNPRSVLSGVLFCSCGDYMRPKLASGTMHYMCVTKEKTKKKACSNRNINGDELDKLVLDEIFAYDVDGSNVNNQLKELKRKINQVDNDIHIRTKSLNEQKRENEMSIKNLIKALASGASEFTISEINIQIEELKKANELIDEELKSLSDKDSVHSQLHISLKTMEEAMLYLKNNFKDISIENKREFIKKIIQKIVWDGENVHIFIRGSV